MTHTQNKKSQKENKNYFYFRKEKRYPPPFKILKVGRVLQWGLIFRRKRKNEIFEKTK